MIGLNIDGLENGEKMNFHISVEKKIRIYWLGCWAHSSPILVKFRKHFSWGFKAMPRLKDYKYFTNTYFD